MKVSPGDIVCSIAGRDKDCYFVVTAAHDNFAYICDGKCRKIEKPKKKKVIHLKTGLGCSDYISDKIKNGESVTNRELKTELRPYVKL